MFKKKESIVLTHEHAVAMMGLFKKFYDYELNVHKTQSHDVSKSTCYNIAILEPMSITGEKGIERVDYLFGARSPTQGTPLRLRIFYSELIAIFGKELTQLFVDRCLDSLIVSYELDSNLVYALNKKYNTFWTFVLFKWAFQEDVNNKIITLSSK